MHPDVLMLVVIGLCLLSVPLTGGNLLRLGELRLRRPGLALAGIGVQVLIVSVVPGGLAGLHEALHVVSYALLGAFGWVNRGVAGVPIVLAGGALNALVILANGGVMPADPDVAHAAANHAAPGEFINSTAVDDAAARLPRRRARDAGRAAAAERLQRRRRRDRRSGCWSSSTPPVTRRTRRARAPGRPGRRRPSGSRCPGRTRSIASGSRSRASSAIASGWAGSSSAHSSSTGTSIRR